MSRGSGDRESGQLIGEYTLELRNENAHGMISGALLARMLTRNLGAALAPLAAIDSDPRAVVMIVIAAPVTLLLPPNTRGPKDANGLPTQAVTEVTGAGEVAVGDAWRWASVTKQVTAALVMQQVDSGRIALDEPVTRYLPDFAGPTGSAVTVRRLLQHTSGLPNPDDTPRGGDGFPEFYLGRGPRTGNAAAARGYCATTPRRAFTTAAAPDNTAPTIVSRIMQDIKRTIDKLRAKASIEHTFGAVMTPVGMPARSASSLTAFGTSGDRH